jgi:hypothetical protein
VYRLWAVLPFVAGVVLVTRWLYRIEGTLTAALFAFLAIQSPLLLLLSRQARGYGLAFLAMGVLTIAAWRAIETKGGWGPVLAFSAAGVLGTWDLPQFGVAFASVTVVLLLHRSVRRRLLPLLVVTVAFVLVWYLSVHHQIASASHQRGGERLHWYGVVLGPIEQLLTPSFVPNRHLHHLELVTYALFALPLAVGISVIWRRSRWLAGILLSGVLGTYFVLFVKRFHLEPRFTSYLLVPLFILVAVGVKRLLEVIRTSRSSIRVAGEFALGLVALSLVAVFLVYAWTWTRYPQDDLKDAAAAVNKLAPHERVVVSGLDPDGFRYYLGRSFVTSSPAGLVAAVCRQPGSVVFVDDPFRKSHPRLTCLARPGVKRRQFRHGLGLDVYRGDRVNVWFLPASGRRTTS